MIGVSLVLSVFAQFAPYRLVPYQAVAPLHVYSRAAISADSDAGFVPALGLTNLIQSTLSEMKAARKVDGASRISIVLDDLHGLTAGRPVVLKGEQIGRVHSIGSVQAHALLDARDGHQALPSQYTVEIELDDVYRSVVKTETVALVTSPRTVGRANGEPVVELFVMNDAAPLAGDGIRIPGYSSYEAFWNGRKPSRTHRNG